MANNTDSLTARTLRIAALRIGTLSLCVGAVSYFLNDASLEKAAGEQLVLSTEQTLQRESLQFREIRDLQQNFLREFLDHYSEPAARPALVRDFDEIFHRHDDGSYTQRPGLFEGQPLADGRRFPGMSATYAPDTPPDDDVKARFALSYRLSYKYGSTAKQRLFNFYGVVPEKGFPIFQDADISKVFVYSGPDALKLETYEFYSTGFSTAADGTFLTRMYFDYSNNAWMTTVATPDRPDASGKRRILACVDVLLDDLMNRVAHPSIQGAYSTLFLADGDGTLIYHPRHLEDIKASQGNASIRSLGIREDEASLAAVRTLKPGQVVLADNGEELIALGLMPETPWVLAIHYPKALMRPSILQNLGIVIALGLLTLLVEIAIIRGVLHDHVAVPLARLIRATRLVGSSDKDATALDLPIAEKGEVGDLARAFHAMALRVREAHDGLEEKVQERTLALEQANRQLLAMSMTDGLTGVANRRSFDETLEAEWRRVSRSNTAMMLAMIDVDWFKKYNDHYGHPAGDDCLRTVARLIEGQVHRPGDYVARYGGEEFALISTVGSVDGARHLAQKIHDALAAIALPHEMSPFARVTVSIGLACMVPLQRDTADRLLAAADAALYEAKRQGRNRTEMAAPGAIPP